MKTFTFFDKILGFLSGTTKDLSDTVLGAYSKEVIADYTLEARDHSIVIEVTGTTTITLPKDLPNGFNCIIANMGVGVVTLAPEVGSLRAAVATVTTQYNACTVYKSLNNDWTALGSLD
jgi:hypothetical protein